MQFHVFQEGRKGARPNNQDRCGYVYTNDCLLMVVCDGMGGHARGEVAAQVAVESLAQAFRQTAAPKLRDPSVFLARQVLVAHEQIVRYAKAHAMEETPRTTCVVAVVQDGRAWWAHVGDSRLYMLRTSAMLHRTMDHSHVQSMIDQGTITEEQAASHPDRNKVFNCLGQAVNPRVEVSAPADLQPGDKLVLCSDGFWGPLHMDFVAEALGAGKLGTNVPLLMDLAESVTGRSCDNLSVVAMDWISNGGSVRDTTRPSLEPEGLLIDDAAMQLALQAVRMACRARPAFRVRV